MQSSLSYSYSSNSTFIVKTNRDFDFTQFSSEDEELEEEYKSGGYHKIEIGETYNDSYVIQSKLGWGHFSTVWHAESKIEKEPVAIKIVKSGKNYYDAAVDEIKILQKVLEEDALNESCVIHLLDYFKINGPNGIHIAMAFEKLGCNLYTLLKLYEFRGLPYPLVCMITKHLVVGLEYLHRCGIIHTDLKPENILLNKTPNIDNFNKNELRKNEKNGERMGVPWTRDELIGTFGNQSYKVKIVDLGNACWFDHHFMEQVQTRQYRAPEVIVGLSYDSRIDIWSLACIVYELLTGDLLFAPNHGDNYNKDDDHLACISELLGRFPHLLTSSGKFFSNYFTSEGELKSMKFLKMWRMKDVLIEKYKFTIKQADTISSFLGIMLKINPSERASARDCLQHPFIKDIDINNFISCLNEWL